MTPITTTRQSTSTRRRSVRAAQGAVATYLRDLSTQAHHQPDTMRRRAHRAAPALPPRREAAPLR